MAHVVGVPKRDSCQKCQLPVFLAERMVVGKKIFHRTCLKCARCRSQLTPGSFYETEVDDEYCCETCPDEEEESDVLLRCNDYNTGTEIRRSGRHSIAERLAFFEQSEKATNETTQKNVSDEQKTKSLQRLGETAAVSLSAFKMGAAFNNFVNDTVDEELANKGEQMEQEYEKEVEDKEEEEEESEEETEGTSLTSTPNVVLCSKSNTNRINEAPQLPTTPSPAEKRFTTTAQLQIKLEEDNLEKNHEKPLPQIKLNNILYNTTNTESNTSIATITADNINNNAHQDNVNLSSAIETLINEEEEVKEAETKIDLVKNYITKDNTDNDNLSQITKTSALEYAVKSEDSKISIDNQLAEELHMLASESSTDEEECIKEQQKEEKQEEEEQQKIVEIRTKPDEDAATTERLSVVRARLQQFEVNNNNDKENDYVEEDNNSETLSGKTLLATEAITSPTVTTVVKLSFDNDMEKKDTEESQVQENVPSVADDNLTNENDVEMRDKNEQNKSWPNSSVEVDKTTFGIVHVKEYPEDLNPFKSDDENEQEMCEENKENLQVKLLQKEKDTLNPFDSSDDEIELEKITKNARTPTSMGKVPPPRPPPPRISRNPFGEDANVESNFSRRSSLSSSLTKKTPVPTPRSNM